MDARIIKYKDYTPEIEAPYNAQFLSDFKAAIPPQMRSWDPSRQRWILRSIHDLATVRAILEEHYENVSETLA